MSKTRVYEVARELGLENREVMERLASLGVQVRNHMSSMEEVEVDRLKRALDKDKRKDVVEERMRGGRVVRRRSKRGKPEEGVAEAAAEVAPPSPARTVEPPVVASPPSVKPVATETPRPVVAAEEPVELVAAKPEPAAPAERTQAPSRGVPAVEADAGVPQPPPPSAPAEPPATVVQEAFESPPPPPAPSPPPASVPAAVAATGPASTEQEPLAASPPPQSAATAAVKTPAPIPRRSLSYEERLGQSDLPPGVVVRGRQVGQQAAQLSEEDRKRIVAEHAARTTGQPPRRRELVRSAIGPTGRQQQRGRPGRARKMAPGKKAQKTEITVPSAAKRVIRIEGEIGLQVLAQRMSLKATDVLGRLMRLGMTGVMINSTLDYDTASILASEFGFEVENVAISDDDLISDARGEFVDAEEARETRPPVVTVMGHVDHGKTSLLDRIRRARVAAGEAGGITQHLGAYRVDHKKGTVVFLDTPGHAAFTAMRARGANATDIVILVVAADDGVMPQTKEAIHHAKAAEVPIVVAVNKIDKEDARPEVIMRDLASEGLQPENWGGSTMFYNVSAISGQGIDELLDGVLLQAEILELRANPAIPAEGIVLESYLDKGRGPVANVLVRNGTLESGQLIVTGDVYGKVRAMTDDRGKQTSSAPPATPVEVLGLSDVPSAGETFHVVTDMKVAQQLAERRKKAAPKATAQRATLETLVEKMKEGDVAELKLVVKADVQGSAEALVKSLTELSTDKVRVSVIHSGAGGITESDVMLASASSAIVIGFHVRPTGGAQKVAKAEQVQIKTYNIIYEALDEVKQAMVGLLKPTYREVSVGRAEVRQIFNIPKGTIAGCFVADGKVSRSSKARVLRDEVRVWEGAIKSLRRVKDDVREVSSGLECGVGLENFNDIKENDIIECFDIEEVSAVL
ncbi:MAG: translation initiation factor IF-2 [Myxococcales bacterium]|nr:translation initiation factor IF-2 [Myxococcales bacterium]MDD9968952.1 translation initiation factor IF-2 [Myxococcales bacterium]